jgi:hypothetical protein
LSIIDRNLQRKVQIMSNVSVRVEREVSAPAPVVYRALADYRQHHHRFLPPQFTNYVVEEGGYGAGTVVSFTTTIGGRTQDFRDVVSEPEPGRVLRETDKSGKVTTFTVEPRGQRSLVQVESVIPTAGGLRGVIERMLVPRVLAPVIKDELERLDAYAADLAQAGSDAPSTLEAAHAASGVAAR